MIDNQLANLERLEVPWDAADKPHLRQLENLFGGKFQISQIGIC